MKHFRFDELLVLSQKEKGGRKIKFDPKTTVLEGENHNGKSTLIKTLFITFGATPRVMHPRWKDAEAYSLVRFSVDDQRYAILHAHRAFAIFDAKGALLKLCRKITDEVAPSFAGLIDFNLQFAARTTKEPQIPPPAFYFVAGYIDQDDGWKDPWNSFPLKQYDRAKPDVIEYHTGIRPNAYYTRKAKRRELEQRREQPLVRQQVLRSVDADLRKRFDAIRFDLNTTDFQAEIERLLAVSEELKRRQDAYRTTIVALKTERDELVAQKSILQAARKELRDDYTFVAAESHDQIACPLCGQSYENGIVERFNIAHDDAQCEDVLLEVNSRIADLDAKVQKEQADLHASARELREVDDLLSATKGEVTLQQLIENESRKGFRKALADDIAKMDEQLSALDAQIRALDDEMARLVDRSRKAEIVAMYTERMEHFLSRLQIHGAPKSVLKKIDAGISGQGSERPRTLLAYAMSIWHVMRRHGSAAYPPIVVDAINQQEQDPKNLRTMYETLRDELPADAQLILGAVNTAGVDFPGKRVSMTKKYGALDPAFFDSVREELEPYLAQIL